jgi:hypothetical protein
MWLRVVRPPADISTSASASASASASTSISASLMADLLLVCGRLWSEPAERLTAESRLFGFSRRAVTSEPGGGREGDAYSGYSGGLHVHGSSSGLRDLDSASLTLASDFVPARACPEGPVDGALLGVAGLLVEPWLGFRVGGVYGALLGGVRASAGLVSKPMYGALAASSRTLEWLSYATLPRMRGDDKHRLKR